MGHLKAVRLWSLGHANVSGVEAVMKSSILDDQAVVFWWNPQVRRRQSERRTKVNEGQGEGGVLHPSAPHTSSKEAVRVWRGLLRGRGSGTAPSVARRVLSGALTAPLEVRD